MEWHDMGCSQRRRLSVRVFFGAIGIVRRGAVWSGTTWLGEVRPGKARAGNSVVHLYEGVLRCF